MGNSTRNFRVVLRDILRDKLLGGQVMTKPTCESCVYWNKQYERNWHSGGSDIIGACFKNYVNDADFPERYIDDFCGEHPDFTAYLESLKEPTDPPVLDLWVEGAPRKGVECVVFDVNKSSWIGRMGYDGAIYDSADDRVCDSGDVIRHIPLSVLTRGEE